MKHIMFIIPSSSSVLVDLVKGIYLAILYIKRIKLVRRQVKIHASCSIRTKIASKSKGI